uniref:Fibrinogen C-terminal domain-containing protein n=1 Tax=Romanomermis culicivorax TaxID=13658 RepID=A0A915HDI8_ROMCU
MMRDLDIFSVLVEIFVALGGRPVRLSPRTALLLGFGQLTKGQLRNACLQHRDNCDQNAVCVPNVISSTFACKCQAGYAGDGVTCSIYSRIPGSCSMQPLQFDCGNGQCLPIEKFRNCVIDCPDGSDESCWTGQIKCDNCKCIDPNDAAQGCTDSSSLCPSPGMFHCANSGGCVYDEMVLDGTPNCPDGSDENYCSTILTNCPPGQQCVYAVNLHNFTCGCPSGSMQSGGVCQTTYNGQPKDCADYQTQSRSISGYGTFTVYYPSCASAGSLCSTLQVSCDFTFDGGGWTIIQKRQNGQLDYYRTWNEYKNGFGSQDNEFWLGNEYVYQLTSTMGVTYELVILMSSIINMQITVRYNRFQLGSQYDFYRLTLGNMIQGDTPSECNYIALSLKHFHSNAADSLQPSRNQRFGTKDQDVDYDPGTSCGIWWRSGWWHDPYCFRTGDLNVPYDPVAGMAQLAGIVWTGVAKDARIRATQMMIRPLGFSVEYNNDEKHIKANFENSETSNICKFADENRTASSSICILLRFHCNLM